MTGTFHLLSFSQNPQHNTALTNTSLPAEAAAPSERWKRRSGRLPDAQPSADPFAPPRSPPNTAETSTQPGVPYSDAVPSPTSRNSTATDTESAGDALMPQQTPNETAPNEAADTAQGSTNTPGATAAHDGGMGDAPQLGANAAASGAHPNTSAAVSSAQPGSRQGATRQPGGSTDQLHDPLQRAHNVHRSTLALEVRTVD